MVDVSPLLANGKVEDGARVYLCPVFHGWAPGLGTAVLGSGLRTAGYRILGRVQGRRQVDDYVADDDFQGFLNRLPAPLGDQLQAQFKALTAPRLPLAFRKAPQLSFTRPVVMGVVNVTPDSFSDGGQHADTARAVAFARDLVAAGADILDIGGESTRPGATPVWEGDEMDRVLPVIAALSGCGVPISVDTRKAAVMTAALEAGADMINDVSALTHDPDSLAVAARAGVPTVLMHAQGTPQTMQQRPDYDDVLLDVYDALAERVYEARAAGLPPETLIVDPGLGFGKRVVEDNLALLRGLGLFHTLGCPLMLGASRKRFIGAITGVDEPSARQAGTLAATHIGACQGVHIHRVHDVKAVRECLAMVQAVADSAMMDRPLA